MSGSSRRSLVSWCLYDFGNSAYSAVIGATIFASYFTQRIVGNESGLGDLWWGRVTSASMLFVALTAPYLGGIADAGGVRKRLWITYTWSAILAVTAFTTLRPGMILQGFILAVIANVGVEGAIVFYNSYLPEIAPPDKQGRVSGWGFATGYAGSIIALLTALPFTDPFRPHTIWLLVAAHFALFSLPAFLFLPPDPPASRGVLEAARHGFQTTRDLVRELARRPGARRFLLAYLFYEDVDMKDRAFQAILDEASFKTKELYGIQPTWTPLFFNNYQLAPWHGGCAWIFQLTENAPTAALLQLRAPFRHQPTYLNLYRRDELIAHELSHVGRMMYQEPQFEGNSCLSYLLFFMETLAWSYCSIIQRKHVFHLNFSYHYPD